MTHRSAAAVEAQPIPPGVQTWPDDATFGAWGHDEHWHPFGHLLTAVVGTGVVTVAGVDHPIDPQRAVWVPPRVPHSARFGPGFAVLVLGTGGGLAGSPTTALLLAVHDRQRLLAARLDGERPAAAEALRLVRRALERPDRARLAVGQPTGPLTAPVAAALAADPSDRRTREQWAVQLHSSPVTVRRAFREETGLAFSVWRARHRLAVALDLLADGRPVSAVAGAVGLTHHGLVAAFHRHSRRAAHRLRPRPAALPLRRHRHRRCP